MKESFLEGEWCIGGDFNQDMQSFNIFIGDMELIDVPPVGKKFTWFCSGNISMSRLDRFLLSESLVRLWEVQGLWVGQRDISDHCLIWLLSSSKNWGPKPFRFNNCWIEHEQFKNFIQKEWGISKSKVERLM